MDNNFSNGQQHTVIFAQELLAKVKNKAKMTTNSTTDSGLSSYQNIPVANTQLDADDQLAREQARKF